MASGQPMGVMPEASATRLWLASTGKIFSRSRLLGHFGPAMPISPSTGDRQRSKRRLFIATIDARLIAVDAATGKPCVDFGDRGVIDLRHGLRIAPREFSDYEQTSPPAILGNVIIVGSGVADNGSVSQPSGEVRGFD